jgi:hypothetical protein
VSRQIAERVVAVARDGGVGRVIADDDIPGAVDSMMWYPAYAPYRPVEL